MDRRTLLRAAGAALAENAAGNAFAQAFTSRPVTLLVPYQMVASGRVKAE